MNYETIRELVTKKNEDISKLLDTLSFYADIDNWVPTYGSPNHWGICETESEPAAMDNGEVAVQAIEDYFADKSIDYYFYKAKMKNNKEKRS